MGEMPTIHREGDVMPLKLEIEKIDEVPEVFRELYVEKDGKFRLQVEGVEEREALKKALDNSRRVEKETRAKVERWEALGKSDQEIKELLAAHKRAEEEKATKAGEWDKLKAQMNETHQKELKDLEDRIAKMQASLEKYLIEAQAATVLNSEKYKGNAVLLMPHIKQHV